MKKLAGLNIQTYIDSGDLHFIDGFSQPFSSNTFQNLPISTAVPNTFSLQLPKKMSKFSVNPVADFLNADKMPETTMQAQFFSKLFQKILIKTQELRQESQKKDTRVVVLFDNLSGLLQGWDSEVPDIDFVEIMNNLLDFTAYDPNNIIAIGINRSLLFGN